MYNARILIIVLVSLCLSVSGCHYFSTDSQISYGLNHYKMGLYNQAIPTLLSAVKSLEKESPPDSRLVDVLIALGAMAESEKRNDLAANFYPRALKAADALQPTDDKRLRNALVYLGMFYSYHERAHDALPILQRAAEISVKLKDQEYHAIDLDNLASAYQNLKQYSEAVEFQSRALKVANELTAAQFPTRGTILHNLGSSYMELGRYEEAEAYFKEAITVLNSGGREAEQWRIKTAKESYTDLRRRMDRAAEAEKPESPTVHQGAPADAKSGPAEL